MKLGKYSIYFLICFFFNLNQSFSQPISNLDIENLDSLPSTYEEEEFLDDNKEQKKSNNQATSVEIKALDKITAKILTLNIKIGEEKIFGNLRIKPLTCKTSSIDQAPDTIAYLQVIDESIKNNDQVYVFNGWMFASSPSLRYLDHAIYDLWLIGCSNI